VCALARWCLQQRQYRLIGQREHKQPHATLLLFFIFISFLLLPVCFFLLDLNFVLKFVFFFFLPCFRLIYFLEKEEEEDDDDDGFRPPPAASPHLSGDGFVRDSYSLNSCALSGSFVAQSLLKDARTSRTRGTAKQLHRDHHPEVR